MARKKSVTPPPEELEGMSQATDVVAPPVDSSAESPTDITAVSSDSGDVAPSEETMNLMEAEYIASMSNAPTAEDAGAENPADIPAGDGDTPAGGDTASADGQSGEATEPDSSGDDPLPETEQPEDPNLSAGAETDTGSAGSADDYTSVLKNFGSAVPSEGDVLPTAKDDNTVVDGEGYSADDMLLLGDDPADDPGGSSDDAPGDNWLADEEISPPAAVPSSPVSAAARRRRERILTIDARDEIQTEEDREAIIWHDIQNSHRTRRILTGALDGVEKMDSGLTIAVVNYKGIRVAIPIKEMLLYTGKTPSGREYMEMMDQLHRILNARLGSEIDFIVKGYDNNTRSVVASRKEAMYRKRQTFYLDTDELGEHMIYEGRVVQARVVAVAEKVIRVEVFGVETSIVARDLSWEWLGNAREHFNVGDRILVRVLRINRTDLEHLSIRVDVRSVSGTNSHDNLQKCMPQCRYVGRVTDVRNGVVFVRLNNGVNAIAHTCYDSRYPGKKDDVSFAVTRLDAERGVAIGIITRIIKQNL